jgi:hypothetical protein
VPSKADRKYRSDFQKLWAVYLGRNTLRINPFCKNVLKIATTWLMLWIAVLIHFSCYCKYIFFYCRWDTKTQMSILRMLIRSPASLLNLMLPAHSQSLAKMSLLHNRLARSGLFSQNYHAHN